MWEYTPEYQYINTLLKWKAPYKLFMLDLDQTMITSLNGKDPSFPETIPNNWQFLGNVFETVQKLSNEDYQIIIITNQININNIKEEIILNVWKQLNGIPLILCANKNNCYKKPNTTFYQLLLSTLSEQPIELYYCGDAVGNDQYPPYRWSSSDLNFANNISARFIRPLDIFYSNYETFYPTEQLVIIMGNIGSGKTTLARRLEMYNNYIRYSQDEVGTLDQVGRTKEIKGLLLSGRKIILDATHSNSKKRQHWVNLANSINISSCIIWIIRDGRQFNKLREKPITSLAYSQYVKYFSIPNETVVHRVW